MGLEKITNNNGVIIELKINTLKANTLTNIGQFDKAISYFSKNVILANQINNPIKKAWSYSGIAETYRLQKKWA